ncbi:MAG TPA: hypothetical protein VKJ47_16605 [Candidatus Binatia bacterium]|nr:hypothetical protein [Candidatus Binatia bacterium]
MVEERARRAQPGAIRRVLRKATAKRSLPLQPEDRLPPGFDRQTLERRIRRGAELRRAASE